jgi:preprotein translocase subunit SecF
VFDKVKENTIGLASTNRVTYTDVVNLSMNQVLARSINTSFVAIMPVFCILVIGSWILGASALNDFGLALFIGLMSGAYSSIFIASPILALLKEREQRYTEIRKRLAAFPQSRQFLTPSTVAGGIMYGTSRVTPPANSGRGYGGAGGSGRLDSAGAGGSRRAGAGPAGNGGATGVAAGVGNGVGAGPAGAAGDLAGPDRHGEDLADEPIINPGPSALGEPAVRSAPTGARRTPPRPRKKVPRRR